MNYNIVNKGKTEYKSGTYLINGEGELHVIFYGSDYGYSLLNLNNFITSEDFYESISEMEHYTNIKTMKLVRQINNVEFEII